MSVKSLNVRLGDIEAVLTGESAERLISIQSQDLRVLAGFISDVAAETLANCRLQLSLGKLEEARSTERYAKALEDVSEFLLNGIGEVEKDSKEN